MTELLPTQQCGDSSLESVPGVSLGHVGPFLRFLETLSNLGRKKGTFPFHSFCLFLKCLEKLGLKLGSHLSQNCLGLLGYGECPIPLCFSCTCLFLRSKYVFNSVFSPLNCSFMLRIMLIFMENSALVSASPTAFWLTAVVTPHPHSWPSLSVWLSLFLKHFRSSHPYEVRWEPLPDPYRAVSLLHPLSDLGLPCGLHFPQLPSLAWSSISLPLCFGCASPFTNLSDAAHASHFCRTLFWWLPRPLVWAL